MSFQWLNLRIVEEKERREREALVRERLPRALHELHRDLQRCVETYREAFGEESAEIRLDADGIRITVRSDHTGEWQPCAQVQVQTVPSLPGFRIESGAEPVLIEVGSLPGDKVLFKHGEQYLTLELVTRLILDRALFPDLAE